MAKDGNVSVNPMFLFLFGAFFFLLLRAMWPISHFVGQSVRRSVGPSVRRSVGPWVRGSVGRFVSHAFSKYCRNEDFKTIKHQGTHRIAERFVRFAGLLDLSDMSDLSELRISAI